MTDTSHSPLLDRYLAEVDRRLGHLSDAQREDILAGILERIADLEADGVAPEEIVARLGSPESVADAAADEFPPPPGEPSAPSRFFDGKRWVQLVAVLLAVRVLWVLLAMPAFEGTSTTADSDGIVTETTTYATVAESAGLLFALILAAIPVSLTVVPFVIRGASRQTATVVCTLLLAGIAVLTGFSVGGFFVLPLVASVCACVVPPSGLDPRRVLGGLLLGVGVVASWLAWNNRGGPHTCPSSGGGTASAGEPLSCTSLYDPVPFGVVGVVALLVAVGLEAWTASGRRGLAWIEAEAGSGLPKLPGGPSPGGVLEAEGIAPRRQERRCESGLALGGEVCADVHVPVGGDLERRRPPDDVILPPVDPDHRAARLGCQHARGDGLDGEEAPGPVVRLDVGDHAGGGGELTAVHGSTMPRPGAFRRAPAPVAWRDVVVEVAPGAGGARLRALCAGEPGAGALRRVARRRRQGRPRGAVRCARVPGPGERPEMVARGPARRSRADQ